MHWPPLPAVSASRWRSLLPLGVGFAVAVVLYGALAFQGALPFMSPDETATFATADSFVETGKLTLTESRATEFPWLHPRSFVAQQGILLPVSFPLWPFVLGTFAFLGQGAIVWIPVLLAASIVMALMRVLRRACAFSVFEALAASLSIAALPTMVLYGNRSLFGLVPQLAAVVWAIWATLRIRGWGGAFAAGAVTAVAVGIRPIEGVWIVPGLLAVFVWARERFGVPFRRGMFAWSIGFLLVAGAVAGLHAWVYGSPFAIGYFLRDLPAVPNPSVVAAPIPVAHWRAFFPYGFSWRQAWENLQGMWSLGWWPWMVAWIGAALGWLWKGRPNASRAERGAFAGLCLLTLWLGVYYGQGRYADHIGGEPFHLGSSLFRYLTPAFVAWTAWLFWLVHAQTAGRARRIAFAVLAVGHLVGGAVWAYTDAVDGILQNRREREAYARVREVVERESLPSTVWLSDRSDKIVFPTRAAASPMPPVEEIRRFLKAGTGPVWIYRRPPSQSERDAWHAAGLELVERHRFERELVYEVRLRAGY